MRRVLSNFLLLLAALLPLSACTPADTARAESSYHQKYGKGIVILYFWGQKCASCKIQNEEIAKFKQYSNVPVEKVLPDAATISKYQLSRTPTLLFFKDGREVDRRIGITYEDQLKVIVKQLETSTGTTGVTGATGATGVRNAP